MSGTGIFSIGGGGAKNVILTDRFGNTLPSTTIANNASIDLRTLTPYDWADIFLSRETSWGVSGFYTNTDAENAIINLVDDLNAAGIWELLHGFYPLVGGMAAKHKWNLRYPFDNDNSLRLNFFSSPTHDQEGMKIINSPLTIALSDNPTNLKLTSFGHFSAYYRAYTAISSNRDLVCSGDSRTITWHLNDPSAGSGTLRMAWCGGMYQINPSPALILTGHWTLNRPNSSNIRQTRNGVLERNISNNFSTTPFFDNLSPYGNFRFFGGTKTASSFTLGQGLTPTQEADLYTAIQKFQTTLGRNL